MKGSHFLCQFNVNDRIKSFFENLCEKNARVISQKMHEIPVHQRMTNKSFSPVAAFRTLI